MKIEIRGESSAIISGYVNVPGRWSRPIMGHMGKFIEKIEPGAFGAAIESARASGRDILAIADHDYKRRLAGTSDGTLKLKEDNVGLFAEMVVTEKRAVERAKAGDIKGWSFGFISTSEEYSERAEMPEIQERTVKELELREISLIFDGRPCYSATSFEVRAEGEEVFYETRADMSEGKPTVTISEDSGENKGAAAEAYSRKARTLKLKNYF